MTAVELTGAGLATADVVAVARHDAAVRLGAHACERMAAGAEAVRRALRAPEPAYGVATGFGSLTNVVIAPDRREELQRALVRSHAALASRGLRGTGRPPRSKAQRSRTLVMSTEIDEYQNLRRSCLVSIRTPRPC